MALLLETVGSTTEPFVHRLSSRDLILYSLGVGAKRDAELDFLFEGRGPRVLPTFAVVVTFEAIAGLVKKVGGNYEGIVHSAQGITLHRPFSPSSTLTTVGKIAGIYDLKRFAQAVFTTETRDETGELVCETEWAMLFRFDGGFDGPRPPSVERHRTPSREPDFVVEEAIAPEQALLYRLSGDWNPLHADPELAKKVGFDAPILHGLCTFGYVGRAVLKAACDGDPARLRALSGQFRRPVFPGETLITRGWREGERVFLQTATGDKPDDVVFGNAQARVG